MGWTGVYKPRKVKEYLNDQYTCTTETIKWEVLASAIVSFRTYYAAVKRTVIATGEVSVVGAICLIQYAGKRGKQEMLYKDMLEDCGAYQVQCPRSILKLLTPTDNEYAIKWREACEEYHKRAALGNRLASGTVVRFKQPLKFTNGLEYSEMQMVRKGKAMRFHPLGDPYSLYRIDKRTLDNYFTSEAS